MAAVTEALRALLDAADASAGAGNGASVEWDCTESSRLVITITPAATERAKGIMPSSYTLKTAEVDGDYMQFPSVAWATAAVATRRPRSTSF